MCSRPSPTICAPAWQADAAARPQLARSVHGALDGEVAVAAPLFADDHAVAVEQVEQFPPGDVQPAVAGDLGRGRQGDLVGPQRRADRRRAVRLERTGRDVHGEAECRALAEEADVCVVVHADEGGVPGTVLVQPNPGRGVRSLAQPGPARHVKPAALAGRSDAQLVRPRPQPREPALCVPDPSFARSGDFDETRPGAIGEREASAWAAAVHLGALHVQRAGGGAGRADPDVSARVDGEPVHIVVDVGEVPHAVIPGVAAVGLPGAVVQLQARTPARPGRRQPQPRRGERAPVHVESGARGGRADPDVAAQRQRSVALQGEHPGGSTREDDVQPAIVARPELRARRLVDRRRTPGRDAGVTEGQATGRQRDRLAGARAQGRHVAGGVQARRGQDHAGAVVGEGTGGLEPQPRRVQQRGGVPLRGAVQHLAPGQGEHHVDGQDGQAGGRQVDTGGVDLHHRNVLYLVGRNGLVDDGGAPLAEHGDPALRVDPDPGGHREFRLPGDRADLEAVGDPGGHQGS